MSYRTPHRWALLVTVSAGLLLITLDNSILYTALPTLARDLEATDTEGLWIINAYPLVMAGLLLGAGTLGDRVGHKRMFLAGLGVFGAASLLAAFSPTPEVLIAARAILAVGAAAMMPATLALIRTTFDDERERNLAIGIWGSIAVVGAALGPIIGGLLLEWFWWGSVFLVNVPVVIAAVIATIIVAPNTGGRRDRPWDLVSSLQAMVALAGLVFTIKELTRPTPDWVVVMVATVAAAGASWLFVRRQRSLPHPLLDFGIFRNPAVLVGVVAAGIAMFAVAGVELATTQRFQLVEGFTPLQAGLLVACLVLGSLPTSIWGGAVLHRVGLRPLIVGGLAITTAGLATSMVLFPLGGLWLLIGLVVMGGGIGFVMSAASTAIVGNVPAHRAGMASSVEEVSYEFGSLIAVAVLGSLLSTIASGDGSIMDAAGPAFDTAYVVVLAIATAVTAVTTVVSLRLTRALETATVQGGH